MNKDYLSIARQRLESQCIICSNKIMITFILTIVILYSVKGFKFNNLMDIIFPIILFAVIYIIVGTIGLSLMSTKTIKKEYDNVKKTVQTYMNDLNDNLFDKQKISEGNAHNAEPLPPLATTIRYPCPVKTLEKFELKTKSEVDELKDDKASAEFGDFDIGCLLKTTPCNVCSGTPVPPGIVAPIPGPQWQPQNAETVQTRIASGNFVPSSCI